MTRSMENILIGHQPNNALTIVKKYHIEHDPDLHIPYLIFRKISIIM